MTKAALVAQLRDIHLPPDATSAVGSFEIAIWPVMLFVIVVGSIVAIARWRRHGWRREARAELRRIDAESDRGQRWSRLLLLARRISDRRGGTVVLPDLAYRDPATLSEQDCADLGAYLSAETFR